MDIFELTLDEISDDFLWEELFEDANRIKRQKPWLDFSEEMTVVIEDPDNGRLGFCSILGQMGQHFGVNVYEGRDGYLSFIELSKEPFADTSNPLFMKKFFNQSALTVSFENREDLENADYELIKSLGLSFRGKNQWPKFRKLEKGCPEALITKMEDIEFLSYCLSELSDLIKEIKMKNLNVPIDRQQFLGRFVGDDNIETGVKIIDLQGHESIVEYRQDIKIHQLKKLPFSDMVWEGIQYYLPSPMFEPVEEKLIFPYLTALINQEDGQVLFSNVSHHNEVLPLQLCEELGKLMLELKVKPKLIQLEDQVLYNMLKHLCDQLGILCELNQDVSEAKQFMKESYQMMSRQLDSLNDVFAEFDDEEDLDGLLDGLSEEEVRQLADILELGNPKEMAQMMKEYGGVLGRDEKALESFIKSNDFDDLYDEEEFEVDEALVEMVEETEIRCQAIVDQFGKRMTIEEKQYFIPIVLIVTELMLEIFDEVPNEWTVGSLQEVCLSILKEELDKKVYAVLGVTLARYILIYSKLEEMEEEEELLAHLQIWFKLNDEVINLL